MCVCVCVYMLHGFSFSVQFGRQAVSPSINVVGNAFIDSHASTQTKLFKH